MDTTPKCSSRVEFDPKLPPLPTLTLQLPPPNILAGKLPTPHIAALFPEITPYRVPDNLFQAKPSKALEETHKLALQEAMNKIEAPFRYHPDGPLAFNGSAVGVDTSSEDFNSAVCHAFFLLLYHVIRGLAWTAAYRYLPYIADTML
jgi:hypothetical protein